MFGEVVDDSRELCGVDWNANHTMLVSSPDEGEDAIGQYDVMNRSGRIVWRRRGRREREQARVVTETVEQIDQLDARILARAEIRITKFVSSPPSLRNPAKRFREIGDRAAVVTGRATRTSTFEKRLSNENEIGSPHYVV